LKAALRRVVVDGCPFFWSYDAEIDHAVVPQERTMLHLRVWGADHSCRPLLVEMVQDIWGYAYLLPSEVAALIAAGLAAGWRPDEHGAPFRLPPAKAPALDRWRVIAAG
jgi:hypothetical protein